MTNLQAACFRCGICCKKYQVRITLPEATHLAESLKITLGNFIDEYTDHLWPGTESFLIRHQDGACLFLEHTSEKVTGCRIHSFRPQDCRDWTAGFNHVECRQGLALWELQINDSGDISGTDENINRFRSFLVSL